MSTPSLPPASSLPTLPLPSQRDVLNLLFEPSTALHTLLTPFPAVSPTDPSAPTTYTSLISQIRTQLLGLANQATVQDAASAALENVLASHPRLGEKGVKGLSKGEQGSLSGEELQEELRRLNAEYEGMFGGLRYVTFVNKRPLDVILGDMKTRIQRGDLGREREDAVNAMCDIALDRAGKLEEKAE